MTFLDKLLDGETVEWKLIKDLTIDKFWIMPATPKFIENDEVPYITSKNIYGGHINFNKAKFISRSDYMTLSRNRPILAGDILISMIGTIGEIARVKDTDLDFYGQNMYLLRLNSEIIDSNYFLHFFDSPKMKNYFRGTKNNSGQGYLKARNIEDVQIPIPCPNNPKKSLAIQAEIVRILDKFTALTATLTTALTAENTARKQQYEYYRDTLLTFDSSDIEWKPLGEVATIKHGKDWKKSGNGNIPVYGSGGIMKYTDKYVYNKPTVLIPRKGSITNIFYLTTPFWNVDTIFYTEIDTDQLVPKFLYYYIKKIDLAALDTGSGRPSLTKLVLKKIKIPIPPLSEQARIVAILDKFDSLTNAITDGLPREIALRKQQYEYYRDLLLNFPKPED